MASEMRISGVTLNARPATRPAEVLEAVPGLIVTQHSGEGKANQYFLRGYNLDHGTDLAIYVDDVPVNMRTHAHGQGYADLNWLMPETINSLDIRKGPYFADEGDFGSVGNLHIGLVDRAEHNTASVTVGSFGYRRLFGMGSSKVGDGTLLVAGEGGVYNGPWDNPDDVRKLNSLVRYTQGTATDGLSLTGMAYANRWNSTDQLPTRAIESGLLPRFGAIDPSDGGRIDRFAVSGRIAGTDDLGAWKANGYAVKSSLDLYNNFTYFLSNLEFGDQFHQHDGRLMVGGSMSRSFLGSLGGLPVETVVGLQTRYDAIDLALTNTYRRDFLSNIRSDKVKETSVSIYAENTVHWTSWLRTTFGWRGDYYDASVDSLFNANNSGHANEAIGSPKFRMVIGPFQQTELFFGAGMGMHSNDARGATTTESPTDPSTSVSPSPFLVRTKGAEVGVRTRFVPGLTSTVSLFSLDQASEIVFSGDAGDTSASRASRRYGVEFTNEYRPFDWLDIDADLALTHARFVGYDSEQADLYASLAAYPEAQFGNAAGNYIPNAPAIVASAGVTVGEKTGWFGGLRWRYIGSVPLTEDNAWRSKPVSIFNARAGYRTVDGWRIQLDVLNLFNAATNQISYGYGSLLKTDSLFNLCYPVPTAPAAVCQNGVMDAVVHPVEPLAVRLTLAGSF
ncbi:TonB-dependent receptor [Bradyrhizobium centrolobii]|uniref:TonB-dependent receptor n=1 Tax=Bradyrhizobium centrolobii TaxID=1505087 RepID=A0A176Y838_9BRAD|nr:TonB-dependent receptor [Bradyrhizobium centrolobii]OAE97712.1 TonB-dependent receptor [Bradyrhizobium centrolobii]